MGYTKQAWNTGDIITANKLNHIENGIESLDNVFLVKLIWDEQTESSYADCNYADLTAALSSGKWIVIRDFFYEGDVSAVYYTNCALNSPFTDYSNNVFIYREHFTATPQIAAREGGSNITEETAYNGSIQLAHSGYIITENGLKFGSKVMWISWYQACPTDLNSGTNAGLNTTCVLKNIGFRNEGFSWSPVPYLDSNNE